MYQFKDHHLYIPAIALITLLISSLLSAQGMIWYHTLALPWYTPPAWAFPIVWNIIYFLTIISAIMFWDVAKNDKEVKILFAMNTFLNVLWTYLFFYMHMLGASLAIAVLLECTIVLMMLLMWPTSWRAALLLLPYLLWVGFAIVLNYGVWTLN
ncbi:MAG: TspO/MBR family protein [Candidatus Babeliales bacterium]